MDKRALKIASISLALGIAAAVAIILLANLASKLFKTELAGYIVVLILFLSMLFLILYNSFKEKRK